MAKQMFMWLMSFWVILMIFTSVFGVVVMKDGVVKDVSKDLASENTRFAAVVTLYNIMAFKFTGDVPVAISIFLNLILAATVITAYYTLHPLKDG